jgi:hypothetical protein
MIKGINSINTAGYIYTGSNGYTPYVSPNSSNPMTGMIRLNGNNYEVFDGTNWQQFGQYADVSLSQSAIAALDWCQRKMIEEAKIKELCEKSPAVADAFATYTDAKSKLEVVLTLADQPQKTL